MSSSRSRFASASPLLSSRRLPSDWPATNPILAIIAKPLLTGFGGSAGAGASGHFDAGSGVGAVDSDVDVVAFWTPTCRGGGVPKSDRLSAASRSASAALASSALDGMRPRSRPSRSRRMRRWRDVSAACFFLVPPMSSSPPNVMVM
ncbi:hypothetical protein SPBR_05333 [Sporothrix brasiliensis 5110]|uniref:Uncharacterized protein n=1 Tax=Sporothrix brasiliensis 5110 TaxID=1398154 RepID=A0A0C2ENV8_9PEZI|nr:uncharacterized protein SPBR_05333 [Sporothrix brasiliensis 5110]KIH87819.1 hypothetical protein SPBR_05333 [Sporothrix brasiliensis 5110]